ncbi:MAG: hypothetical protein HYT93_05170 [Parcubacteria group bacterium]|nr:hypothetical protein [Parcubacteria group bacterium]
MGKLLTNRNFYSVLLAVVVSFVFVAVMVSGATTISTNISTGGTLSVSGDSTLTGDVFASSTAAFTGQTSFYDIVVLDNGTSDPTGVSAGSIYWDTTNEVIRAFDGIDWNTVASSTDAAGGLILAGDGQGVRFNTIANAYMALGTTTLPVVAVDSGNAILHVNATTSASVPLVLIGSGAFGANLLNVYNHVQTEVFSLDTMGNASTTILSTTANVLDALAVSGYATTSGATGNFATEGTVSVGGGYAAGDGSGVSIGTTGNLQVNADFEVNGYATTTAASGNFATAGNVDVIGTIGIGTTTPAFSAELGVTGDIHADSGATTTLSLHTDAASRGTCIQMRALDGTIVKIYATSTPGVDFNARAALVVEAGTCQ